MPEAPFDEAVAHRWFAIEMNNSAWDLVEAIDRSAEQAETMLHAAHAACLHWRQVGKPINEVRALCLLATAYLAADMPSVALRYAKQCVELSDSEPEGQSDFDRATACLCAARSYAGVGQDEAAKDLQRRAIDYALLLEEAEDKKYVTDKIAAGNWYGIDVPTIG